MNVLYHVVGKENNPEPENAAHLKMVDINVPLKHSLKLRSAIMDLVQVSLHIYPFNKINIAVLFV